MLTYKGAPESILSSSITVWNSSCSADGDCREQPGHHHRHLNNQMKGKFHQCCRDPAARRQQSIQYRTVRLRLEKVAFPHIQHRCFRLDSSILLYTLFRHTDYLLDSVLLVLTGNRRASFRVVSCESLNRLRQEWSGYSIWLYSGLGVCFPSQTKLVPAVLTPMTHLSRANFRLTSLLQATMISDGQIQRRGKPISAGFFFFFACQTHF